MKKTSRKRRSQPEPDGRGRLAEILGLFLLALTVLTLLALATYQSEAEDLSPRQNILSGFGDQLSYQLIHLTFGRWPSFVFPLLLFLWALAILFRWKKLRLLLISFGLTFAAFWISFAITMLEIHDPNSEHAGWIGVTFGTWIYGFMGAVGAWIVWTLFVLVGLILVLRVQPSLILKSLINGIKKGSLWLWSHHPKRRPKFEFRRKVGKRVPEGKTPSVPPGRAGVTVEEEDQKLEDLFPPAEETPGDAPYESPRVEPQVTTAQYQFPPLSLLSDAPPESPDAPEELKAKATRLQEALSDFGVGARVVRVNPGPVITRFDLKPDPGVKVSRISALADDLALVLRARAIRIQAPIPGEGAVGVEIPNSRPAIVSLKEVVSGASFVENPSPLAIALGRTASGDPYVTDLGRMPHLLVAGTTGSGKSVCLNAVIASLLLRNPPERLQFVIIDPKKLELSIYARLARHHLMTSPELDEEVITTPSNAVRVLGGVEIEMARRYDVLAAAGVRNIEEFNELAEKGQAVSPEGETLNPISFLVVVIDELADLMMIMAKDVEEPIARLAQMARAVGIHLIVATQRPSVDVITGVIKANFPARLAFQVASKIDSRTILDANGAESLLGNGDALFIPPGRGQPERIHCCYVGPDEIENLVSHIEDQPCDFYRHTLRLPQPEGAIGGGDEMLGDRDEFFEEAARMVIRQGQASVSILQRRLKIGYARAGRLIDQLERAGIVGPFDGSKAREVLVDEEYLDQISGGHPPQ